ncbi:hypothetical protein Pla22_17030 [Rubripirellula amarantea]|uniref:Uncharacterized protein n=1 Tax=Rubripirellula amarantea TaxID=2527999 RepID=A0A5C5WU19_9BACT|nr:hypothetical protein Pla22_17030 [Rubripirellula amarantea]
MRHGVRVDNAVSIVSTVFAMKIFRWVSTFGVLACLGMAVLTSSNYTLLDWGYDTSLMSRLGGYGAEERCYDDDLSVCTVTYQGAGPGIPCNGNSTIDKCTSQMQQKRCYPFLYDYCYPPAVNGDKCPGMKLTCSPNPGGGRSWNQTGAGTCGNFLTCN